MTKKETTRIVHISDPHLSNLGGVVARNFLGGKRFLGALSWRRRSQHHLSATLDSLIRCVDEKAPDLIVVTGDLVQIGLHSEIDQAKEWLERLSKIAKIILVPGNHDFYQADSMEYACEKWRQYLWPDGNTELTFPSMVRLGNTTVIGLSSAQPEPFWSARGMVDDRQLEQLEKVLKDSVGTVRCVLIHHPPIKGRCPYRKSLRNSEALKAMLERERVELVLHGHIHRNTEYEINGYTKVFSTASASNKLSHAPSSFRVFDLFRDPLGLGMVSTLGIVRDSGCEEFTTRELLWNNSSLK
jgi:3',5'-cyclic AMP phosphodiesterase CpdA